jgi:hypothetical protein
MEFMEQLLKTSFSLLLKKNSEKKMSLLLRDFHKNAVAEMC